MDERIILLETSTALCSAALVENGSVVCERLSDEPRSHASLTAVFVDEMLRERGLRVSDCSAVCLSMGPGSYTGLRVGSSTAKGLCFGGGIPLLAVGTLDVLVAQALEEGLPEGCTHIVPMIDARRMEVYTAVYSAAGEPLTEVAPVVVEGMESIPVPPGARVLFIGDGVQKCADVLAGPGMEFRQECPRAASMRLPALSELHAGHKRDTAYFEPFYLKDFVATVSTRGRLVPSE